MLYIRDLAVAGAIDAGSAVLIVVETKHRMVEHIEGVHAELQFHPLGEREILQD